MNRRMAFRLWIDDWEGGTSYMTNEEAGAYLRLLIYQFRNGSIPPAIFDRINHGLTTVEQVRNKFELIDGHYVQHRMAEIRHESIQYSEKQSIKGKKSAQQRLNNGLTTVQPHGSGSGSGIGNKDKIGGMGEREGNAIDAEISPTFEELWNLYDHKVGKEAAKKAYKRLRQHDREAAYAKIPAYLESLSDRKFQAHLSTWLNGRRWEDEYQPKQKKSKYELFSTPEEYARFLAVRPDGA